MQTRRFTQLLGITLAAMLASLVGQGLVFGHDDSDRTAPSTLEGTWNVILQFPVCSTECPCPGNTPNIPTPGLQMYLKHGSYLAASGGSLFSGPQLGSWERLGPHQFEARYKFFLFNADGSRRGYEEVTNHIHLTGPDTFEATAIFDLFDAAGTKTSPEEGCTLNTTATRFE